MRRSMVLEAMRLRTSPMDCWMAERSSSWGMWKVRPLSSVDVARGAGRRVVWW